MPPSPPILGWFRLLAPVILWALWIALFPGPSHGDPGPSRADTARQITAVRVDAPPVIDGALDEAAWRRARQTPGATAGDFFRAQQTRGVPARLRTEAYVLYDDETIYVGFLCWEPDMDNLRETLTRRDTRIWGDDAVEVVVDTYHDRRNAYVFGVTTLETQMDERVSNESAFTMSWNATWQARVRKYEDRWSVEIALPLSQIQYDPDITTWGINFWRAHPIDQEAYSWSDTGGDFGRISEFGQVRGLQLPAPAGGPGRRLAVLPYASYRALQDRADDADAGLDLIARPSATAVANLTVFPDFSQLEADPTQINVNDERELSLPERRPFYRDGAELFDLPLRLFYTRRVQEIDLGLKGTGKTGRTTWAAVNTIGKVIDRYDGNAKRRANLLALRANRDIGERTVVGAMAVHKHQADRRYGLLSLNSRAGLGRDWVATGQFVGASRGGAPRYAWHASTDWRNQSGVSGFVEWEEIRDGFRPNETGLEDEAYRRHRGSLTWRNEFAEDRRLSLLWLRGRLFRQADAGGGVRERYAQAESIVDVGRVGLYGVARLGQLREADRLRDLRFVGGEVNYSGTWLFVGLFHQIGERRGDGTRFSRLWGDANLFERLTLNLDASRFDWTAHEETWVLRSTTNYQFTRRVGLRLFHERVVDGLADTAEDYLNTVLDVEFTPESHFYLVGVRDQDDDYAAFSKLAWLFGGG